MSPPRSIGNRSPCLGGGESDDVTGSAAVHHVRPPPRLDNTECFVIIPVIIMLNSFPKQVSKFVRIAGT